MLSLESGFLPPMGAGGPPFPAYGVPWWECSATSGVPPYSAFPSWGFAGYPGAQLMPGNSPVPAAAAHVQQHSGAKERKGKSAGRERDREREREDKEHMASIGHGSGGGGKGSRAAAASAATAASDATVAAESVSSATLQMRSSSASKPPAVEGHVNPSSTTVMLRNIPNRYTQHLLVSLLEESGFKAMFDFVYLPMDFRNGVNLGYAFVNLTSHEDALRLMDLFQGFSKWYFDSAKVCEVSWAHPHQGLQEHVDRYRNSPVMHACMPDEYKPMMFKNGVRIPFPGPTKAIRAPKLRPVRDRADRPIEA